jgi:hypothetical protein
VIHPLELCPVEKVEKQIDYVEAYRIMDIACNHLEKVLLEKKQPKK